MQLRFFLLSLLFDLRQLLLDKLTHFLWVLFARLTPWLLRRQAPATQILPHSLQGRVHTHALGNQLGHRLPRPRGAGDVVVARQGIHYELTNLLSLFVRQGST
jgi:hypothetical protein